MPKCKNAIELPDYASSSILLNLTHVTFFCFLDTPPCPGIIVHKAPTMVVVTTLPQIHGEVILLSIVHQVLGSADWLSPALVVSTSANWRPLTLSLLMSDVGCPGTAALLPGGKERPTGRSCVL